MAKLIIFDDCVRGVDLPDRAVIVGRSLKADIPIRDRLLSRKHCTLISEGSGYRLLDLKSANGSFVNGVRVVKVDLECDDVIEIGSTVMVLLESDTWERGEGLTKLRNPLKAQELIQRIKRHAQLGPDHTGDGPSGDSVSAATEHRPPGTGGAGGPSGKASGDRDPFGRGPIQWTRDLVHELELTPELLEGFLTNRIASLLVRRTPELRECLSDAMERVLSAESFDGGVEKFRALVRDAIRTSLQDVGLTGTVDSAVHPEASPEIPEPTPRDEPSILADRATQRVQPSPASEEDHP